MKKNWKNYLSVLLSVLMLVGMLTIGVSAATTNQGTINPGDWPPNNPNRPDPNAPMNPAPNDDYEEDDDTMDIIVRKKWVGDNENIRPSEVTVQLIENGDPIGNPVKIQGSKQNEKNWKYTWKNMDEDSEYTIVEIDIPEGYVSTVENVRANYWVITNTYNQTPAVKENPETGASDFSGAAVALAVCFTVCSASLMLKRK